MKDISYYFLVLATTLLFSCAKTQNCECSYTDADGKTVTLAAVELKGSKKKIKEACDSKSKDWSDANGTCIVK